MSNAHKETLIILIYRLKVKIKILFDLSGIAGFTLVNSPFPVITENMADNKNIKPISEKFCHFVFKLSADDRRGKASNVINNLPVTDPIQFVKILL